MKPPRSILSPDFVYRNAAETDLAKTFARIRREQKKDAEAQAAAQEDAGNVRPITTKRKETNG